jgi:hypothetical protein
MLSTEQHLESQAWQMEISVEEYEVSGCQQGKFRPFSRFLTAPQASRKPIPDRAAAEVTFLGKSCTKWLKPMPAV